MKYYNFDSDGAFEQVEKDSICAEWCKREEVEEELSKKDKKIAKLQEDLDHHAHMVLKLENELGAVRNANKINCLQIEKLNDEIELARSGFSSADKERNSLRKKVLKMKGEIDAVRNANRINMEQIDDQNKEIEKLREAIASWDEAESVIKVKK